MHLRTFNPIKVARRVITRLPIVQRRLQIAVLDAAKVEREWYDQPMMTRGEIREAIQSGRLVRVKQKSRLKITRPTKQNPLGGVQYPFLAPKAARLLRSISISFAKLCKKNGLAPVPLTITSMTRDAERQIALRTSTANPAAEISTHGLGEAFDVNVGRWREGGKLYVNILMALLTRLHKSGRINLIDETPINGALHVARNPQYKERRRK